MVFQKVALFLYAIFAKSGLMNIPWVEKIYGYVYFKYKAHYEAKDLLYILEKARESILFFDVGANIGFVSMFMAKKLKNLGKVYAIEPEKENIKQLENNLNSFNNTTILPYIISDTNAIRYLKLNPIHPADHKITNDANGIPVQSMTLDSLYDSIVKDNPLLKELKILVKVDVQGAELLVLKGALNLLKNVKPELIIEVDQASYDDYNYKIETVFNLLEEYGYSAYQIKKDHIIKITSEAVVDDQYQDVLFINAEAQTLNSLNIQLPK